MFPPSIPSLSPLTPSPRLLRPVLFPTLPLLPVLRLRRRVLLRALRFFFRRLFLRGDVLSQIQALVEEDALCPPQDHTIYRNVVTGERLDNQEAVAA